MSTDITTFVFPQSNTNVRTLIIDEEPWFVAKDVCDVLEITNVSQALSRLDDSEKDIYQIYTLMGEQSARIINESGLYSLIIRSDKPKAVEFRKWITGEVLPSIRKTGSYALVASKNSEIAELRDDMREIKGMMRQLIDIVTRNEPKIATHDLLVASDLLLTMRETGAILGFRDVRAFTALLREYGVLIKRKYSVTYSGTTYQRFRNTPTAKWRHLIDVKSQFSGENVVTVPYAKPQAVAALHMELMRRGHDVPPLPTVDEQREIVEMLRARNEIESVHDN